MVGFYCFFGDEFVCDGVFELLDRGGCEGELELVFEGVVELVVEFDEVGLWWGSVVHVILLVGGVNCLDIYYRIDEF